MERGPEQASADNRKMVEGLTVIRGMLIEEAALVRLQRTTIEPDSS